MVYSLVKISSVASFWDVETFNYFIEDPDLEHLILDKTMVQVHACAAGKKGRYSTQIHMRVDGLGNPLELRITGGERNEITQAEELIENWQEEDTKVIGDKGYDAYKLIEKIGESKAHLKRIEKHSKIMTKIYTKKGI